MRFINKISDYISGNPKGQLIPLFLILAVSSIFYFHNLGTSHITLWDEAVHVNVVKNLANDCCVPKLHLTDIGIDFQDWTNNYIWTHKPLMPLFLQAAVYKVGGGSLFAFRLPAVLFALMSVVALFFTARRHFGYIVALVSSSLFAFNSYVFELVKGRQFSGLHDLCFLFFGILALGQILRIIEPSKNNFLFLKERELRWNYILFGLFAGLGYLSKGGIALLFFPVLCATVLISKNKKTSILNFLYAVLATLVIIFPEKIILLLLYPAEYFFEQSVQVLHLFKDLEYWGRPWDYYLTIYMRDFFLPYLYFPAVAGILYGMYKARTDKRLVVLSVWVLSFLLPLSFGVTKISNFIFVALPAMLVLIVLMFEWLWQKKHHAIIFALSATAALSYLIIRLDLWRVKYHLFQDQTAFQRFAILLYEVLLFFALWIICRMFEKYWSASFLAKASAVLSLFLILGTYARANQLSDGKSREDYQYQTKIKRAAAEFKGQYPSDAIFLLFYPELIKSHLYFQYWSGFDALEIYDRQPIFVLKKILSQNRPVFVLSEKLMAKTGLRFVEKNDSGYFYALE